MTQGPAIRKSGAPAPPSSPDAMCTRFLGLSRRGVTPSALLERRADEGGEQRMRLERLGLGLGVGLGAEGPGGGGQVANLDGDWVGGLAGQGEGGVGGHGFVFAGEI